MKLKPIGYFSKSHGLKGHLILFTEYDFFQGDAFGKDKLNVVFIEQGGSQAPFFIEELKPFNNGFLVKLEGVNDINAAALLKNKEVLAEEKYTIKEKGFEYLYFTLIDEMKGEVGVIEGLEGNMANPLLKVMAGEKEILLPFSEELIIKAVKAKKQLFYRAPDGLIEMYLEG
jgi:16S rRNA processing protein RimM